MHPRYSSPRPENGPQWYCVRSRSKSEHIAAQQLRELGLEVFLPRIRFKRLTRRGPIWVTEALFPNYLFCLFDRNAFGRQVRASNGVSSIVHFGEHWPAIPAETILELRSQVGAHSIHNVPHEPSVGDEVQVAGGPLSGLAAVVTKVLPGPERVRVLLDFLGRQTSAELKVSHVVPARDPRMVALDPAEATPEVEPAEEHRKLS